MDIPVGVTFASASIAGNPKPDVIARVVGVTFASASVVADPKLGYRSTCERYVSFGIYTR